MKPQQTWRRLVLALLLAGFAFVLLVAGVRTPSEATAPQGRQVEYNIPKTVPIKLKFKAEKEAKVKDMSNTEWLRDFELEVTNTSDKPIYYLELWLTLPETKSENNNPLAFSLRFGRVDFIYRSTRPVETDVPLKPGETHVFSIEEKWRQGWSEFKNRTNKPEPEKLSIDFVHLSFGDGSGFDGGGVAYPYKRDKASNSACPTRPTEGEASRTKQTLSWTASRASQRSIPTIIRPVIFF